MLQRSLTLDLHLYMASVPRKPDADEEEEILAESADDEPVDEIDDMVEAA